MRARYAVKVKELEAKIMAAREEEEAGAEKARIAYGDKKKERSQPREPRLVA